MTVLTQQITCLWRMQIVRFLSVSVIATLVDVGMLKGLTLYLPARDLHLTLAIAVAYVCGILTHFTLSRRFVFDPSAHHVSVEFSLVFTIGLIALALTEGIVHLLHKNWGMLTGLLHIHLAWEIIYAKAVAIVIVFFWNFLARRYLVYRQQPSIAHPE